MKKKPIRIKDIARILNLSTSTVSRALRDTHDVNPYTRKQVLETASRLGYRTNVHAAALASGSTRNILVVIPFITNYYFSKVVSGIQEVAYNNKYNVMLFLTNDSSKREKHLIENISISNWDGLLASIAADTSDCDYFNHLIVQGMPTVFFDRVPEKINTSKVLQDDYSGAFMATDHLINKGYRRIAHFAGNEHLSITQNRLNGYKAALKKHRIPFKPEWVFYSGFSQESGEDDMEKVFKLPDRDKPNGIFAVNDRRAVGAIIAIKRKGLTVGKDIGVIGFTNDPISTIIEPSLSTIEEPAFEIGKQSCDLLLRHIKNSNFPPKEIVLSGNLIERNSTRRS